jgi:hypothetical protein
MATRMEAGIARLIDSKVEVFASRERLKIKRTDNLKKWRMAKELMISIRKESRETF